MGSIRVSNLGKAYKQYASRWSRLAELLLPFGKKQHQLKWILQDIDFHIEAGEAVGIIGINGAGKSTLLKLITGTTQATTGQVNTSGRVAALLELGMGFHPDFTGRQNALMAGQLAGWGTAEISALMPQIEDFAEIGEYIDQPVRVYSSGMQVRLAFSVATAIRPDILIVDEALAVGDVFFQQKCFDRIRAYCAAGTTLLFVSHAVGTVYSLCNRAILIAGGRIALDSTPRAVIDLYNAQILRQQNAQHPTSVDTPPPASASALASAESGTGNATETDDLTETHTATPAEHTIGSLKHPSVNIQAIDLHVQGKIASTLISESTATARIHVAFAEHYPDPHIGFQIRNARGEPVFMTNTYCMRQNIGPVRSGENIIAEFTFKAGLAEGDYTITAGVAEGGTGEGAFKQTLARRQDALAFTVLKNLDAITWSGVYNLDPVCRIQRT